MKTEKDISSEHIAGNQSVRKTLIERGVSPEKLPPDEDVQKTERRLKSEMRKRLKTTRALNKKKKAEKK